jgi:YVTN family beta-propeller protein
MTKNQRRCFAAAAAVLFSTAVSTASDRKVRIIQTNSAGDNIHVIDPETNKVVGVITGIEVNHGAAVAPDGSRIYVSDEAESTLDVVDAKTLKVTNRIPLSATRTTSRSAATAGVFTSGSSRRRAASTSSTLRR